MSPNESDRSFPHTSDEMLFHLIWKVRREHQEGLLSPKENDFYEMYRARLHPEIKAEYDYHDRIDSILEGADS